MDRMLGPIGEWTLAKTWSSGLSGGKLKARRRSTEQWTGIGGWCQGHRVTLLVE
jgi:hypothetical protein